jgi:NAD dependent epimerase/dehydratase family enzyme
MQTVLITGGTGMIGQALAKQFITNGYEVIILSRNPKRSSRLHLSYAKWDIEKGEIDLDALAKANTIVHLAGEGVADKRWTVKRKQAIVDSRVQSGNLLVKLPTVIMWTRQQQAWKERWATLIAAAEAARPQPRLELIEV